MKRSFLFQRCIPVRTRCTSGQCCRDGSLCEVTKRCNLSTLWATDGCGEHGDVLFTGSVRKRLEKSSLNCWKQAFKDLLIC